MHGTADEKPKISWEKQDVTQHIPNKLQMWLANMCQMKVQSLCLV